MNIDEPDHHQDNEIPLLDDVVAPDDATTIEAETNIVAEVHGSAESSVPAYETTRLKLRDEIMTQLEEDLRPMIAQAVDRSIAETTTRIGQILHNELAPHLEHHVHELIAQYVEREFGPRERR